MLRTVGAEVQVGTANKMSALCGTVRTGYMCICLSELMHVPFRAVDITRESDGEFQQLSIFTELQAAHASLT